MSKIAILGYGIVGSGTVEVFYKNKENLEKKTGKEIDIKYILDIRDFPESLYKDKFVSDFEVIVNDPEIDVVTELIGGKTFAYDYVKRSLLAGKSIVTSNKELVAECGAELLEIARKMSVNFFFEASVGGGIPIIRPLHQCLLTDEIKGIVGILNGTTNFILTKMVRENMPFDKSLSIAQEFGYAEKNPAADIEGQDTCRKICILASLAFGKHVYPRSIHVEGITNITLEDLEYAGNFNSSVKLIGIARAREEKLEIIVCPMLVSNENQISGVNDVFNAILIQGEATGEVLFYGKGAGKYPTASAVVSDIVNASKMNNTSKSLIWKDTGSQDFILDYKEQKHRFYLRIKGSKQEALSLFGNITLLNRKNASSDELAFITEEMFEKNFDEKVAGLEVLGKIRVLNF